MWHYKTSNDPPPKVFQIHFMQKVFNADLKNLIFGIRCYHSGEIMVGEHICDRPISTY